MAGVVREDIVMTWKELRDLINAMSPGERICDVYVWPPEQCPAVQGVRITGIGKAALGTRVDHPVLLTGKEPQ